VEKLLAENTLCEEQEAEQGSVEITVTDHAAGHAQ